MSSYFGKNTFTIVPDSFLLSDDFKELSGNAVKIYLVLSKHSDGKGKPVFPKQKRIQDMSGLSDYQVRKALQELEEKCVIQIKRGQIGNTYYFSEETNKSSINNFDDEKKEEMKSEKTNIKPIENLVSNTRKTKTPILEKPSIPNKELEQIQLEKTTNKQNENNKQSSESVVVNFDFIKMLLSIGVYKTLANNLVKTYPNAPYKEIVQDAVRQKQNIQNISGWIKTAVEKQWDYSLQEAEKEKAEQLKIKANERKKQEEDEEKVKKEKAEKIKAIYNSLPNHDKQRVDEIVDQKLFKMFGESGKDKTLFKNGLRITVTEELFYNLL